MRIPATAPKISPEGELATLQDYLTHYRRTLLMKCESLNAEQLAVGQPRRRPCRCSVCSGTSPRQSGLARLDPAWRPHAEAVRRGRRRLRRSRRRTVGGRHRICRPSPWAGSHDAVLAEHPDLSVRLGKDAIAVRELLVHRIERRGRGAGG